MNIDAILATLSKHSVDYILIGGVNFLLNHAPILTFDVDIWIRDDPANRSKLTSALMELRAEWGPTEQAWKPIGPDAAWLSKQSVYCLTSIEGAIDVFREVKGLEGRYDECKARASARSTSTGIAYSSLSDDDMLRCQEALELAQQHHERVKILREAIAKRGQKP